MGGGGWWATPTPARLQPYRGRQSTVKQSNSVPMVGGGLCWGLTADSNSFEITTKYIPTRPVSNSPIQYGELEGSALMRMLWREESSQNLC